MVLPEIPPRLFTFDAAVSAELVLGECEHVVEDLRVQLVQLLHLLSLLSRRHFHALKCVN